MTNRISRPHVLIAATLALLVPATTATGAKTLRWKFTAGQEIRYEQTQEMTMTMDLAGNEVKTSMKQVMNMVAKVDAVDEKGVATITQSIERFQMTVNSPDAVISIDTREKAPTDDAGRQMYLLLKTVTEAKIKQQTDPQGKVSNVEIPKEVVEKLKEHPSAGSLGPLTSAEGLKTMFEQGTPAFPEAAVDKGTTWNQEFKMKDPNIGTIAIESIFTYTGEAQADGKTIDEIGVKMKMAFAGDKQGGPTIKITDQKSDGIMRFDNAEGQVVDSKVKQLVHMEIEVAGQTFTQKLDQTVSTKRVAPEKNRK
jgi:hypothetical protein